MGTIVDTSKLAIECVEKVYNSLGNMPKQQEILRFSSTSLLISNHLEELRWSSVLMLSPKLPKTSVHFVLMRKALAIKDQSSIVSYQSLCVKVVILHGTMAQVVNPYMVKNLEMKISS